jgi:hypothetical protein
MCPADIPCSQHSAYVACTTHRNIASACTFSSHQTPCYLSDTRLILCSTQRIYAPPRKNRVPSCFGCTSHTQGSSRGSYTSLASIFPPCLNEITLAKSAFFPGRKHHRKVAVSHRIILFMQLLNTDRQRLVHLGTLWLHIQVTLEQCPAYGQAGFCQHLLFVTSVQDKQCCACFCYII